MRQCGGRGGKRAVVSPSFIRFNLDVSSPHSCLYQGLRDPDAHVRWAACQALGQMCTDLGPDLQQQQHAAILPGLMAVMDDFNAPRVQASA